MVLLMASTGTAYIYDFSFTYSDMYIYMYMTRSVTYFCKVFASLTGSYAGNYGPPDGFDWDGILLCHAIYTEIEIYI